MSSRSLVVRAGPRATERLRAEGFHPDLFSTLVGASGGPKWLVLRHLDDALADRLIEPRSSPIDTLGSSIGSFRHACHAMDEPRAAFARFAKGYIEQRYDSDRPSKEAISEESDRILADLLGENGAAEIVSNEQVRTHIVAARLRSDRGRDRGTPFFLQLAGAAFWNAMGRRRLGRSFERILFGNPADSGDGARAIRFRDFPTVSVNLSADGLRKALLSSGSIPLLMAGVREVPGAPGVLFDGGIVDYHFDFEFERRPGLVLFPHFFDRIVPGWFDRPFKQRRPQPAALDDVVMIAPSDAFVASLPGSKVPDRNDFLELETEARIERWNDVTERCRVLAEEFEELVESGKLADVALPFPN